MFHLDNESGISNRPAIAPLRSQQRLWFTEGGHGNAISYPGADWFNIVQAELLSVLDEAGIAPDKGQLNQIAQAIRQMSEGKAREYIEQLGQADGFKFIGQAESVEQLRTIRPAAHGQRILVKSYYAGGTTGGGEFVADLQDLVTPDDNYNYFRVGQALWKRVNIRSKASVKYQRINDIDIVTVEIKNPNCQSIRKVLAGNNNGSGTVLREMPRAFAKKYGAQIVINADGFQGPNFSPWSSSEYGVPGGLQISEGQLIKDWQDKDAYKEALIYLKNGTFAKSTKGDGISGEEWIRRGAVWSVCFAGFMIENGRISRNVNYEDNIASARVAFCTKEDGSVLIVAAEGKSNQYGFTIPQFSEYLLSLGCEMAYCMDGGGSAQVWWKDCYALHSSDNNHTSERALPSFFVLSADNLEDFDTGWNYLALKDDVTAQSSVGVRWRQQGNLIRTEFNVTVNLEKGVLKTITEESYPRARRAYASSKMKCVAVGDVGKPVGVFCGGGKYDFSAVSHVLDANYFVGEMRWVANNS